MIRLVVACIHHDAYDSIGRCFASFNCASVLQCGIHRISLDQIRRHFSSLARCESSEDLFSSIQIGSFTPDEVMIDPGAVPRTAALAHMLRTSLKTAISCLTLRTWVMCLHRQTTGRVLFILLALVAASQQARLPLNQDTALVEHPLSSELSGWSALGFASPLAHQQFDKTRNVNASIRALN